MGKPTRLTDEQVNEALSELSGWDLSDGKLHREFKFADFVEGTLLDRYKDLTISR